MIRRDLSCDSDNHVRAADRFMSDGSRHLEMSLVNEVLRAQTHRMRPHK